jgi:hypothetical protein
VPKSTVFGTLATAVVYMLSLTAVFGIVPSAQLAKSDAPFSTVVNTMFGGTWVGYVMAVVVKWRITDNRAVHTPRFARDMIVAVLSLMFSILFAVYSRNTGHPFFTYWAPFLLAGGALLLGIPVYIAQRGKMTEPQAVPEYR